MGALIGGGAVALTVHGPAGAVDLVVPSDAFVGDVAREYAAQTGLPSGPVLATRSGTVLPGEATLASRRVRSGDLLVAAGAAGATGADGPRSAGAGRREPDRRGPAGEAGAGSAGWAAVAAGVALVAGWAGAHVGGTAHDAVVVLLALAAASGLVPVGGYAVRRAVAAPAFAGAAAFAVVWSPELARIPTVLGVTALVAAVAAALVRAVDRRAEEALRVWIVAGVGVFAVTFAAALLGLDPQVVWAVLLVAAVFAARLVPSYVVDVPDHYLLDLERLAVSAWSARERPGSRRGRTLVPLGAVGDVADRGARTLTAASWAISLVAVVSAPLLLATATAPVDRVGARVVVVAGALAMLLSARSYRYALPRGLLRAGGVAALATGVAAVLGTLGPGLVTVVCVASVGVGLVLVVVAVATGRGWRSVWWSARAELAEALAGATALGTLVVATGLFRSLWESGLGV